ncbi:MAG: hypothetical protein ACOCXP_04270 [Candidatus Dojkabacteria bacterium]
MKEVLIGEYKHADTYVIGDRDNGFFAEVVLWLDESCVPFEATVILEAPRRGVEIMSLVSEFIQAQTDRYGVTITHHYQATNEAARVLIAEKCQHLGYAYLGIDENEVEEKTHSYMKVYYPREMR